MRRQTGKTPVPAWRVGDRAIVEIPRTGLPGYAGTVTSVFPITAGDAAKLSARYPWIEAGEIVLVLAGDDGLQHLHIASDPALRRVMKTSPETRA